jgi:hypothetical protein
MKNKPYSGHPSWAHWNVLLWFRNEEALHNVARECKSGSELYGLCKEAGFLKTADGAKITKRLCQYVIGSYRRE